jgi:hypothetical protein
MQVDPDHDMAFLDQNASPGHGELGGWHFHPRTALVPSLPDLRRAGNLARSLDLEDRWIEIICGPVQGSGDPPMQAWALYHSPAGLEMRPAKIVRDR